MTASIDTVKPPDIPTSRLRWQPATWEEYLAYRDQDPSERVHLFFHNGYLWINDMGGEGIKHAGICDLFTMILGFWFSQHPQQTFSLLGRCLMEKPPLQAGAPDIVLYLGEDYPRWQVGEPRQIDLTRWRVPDLVGEISDTTLAMDLDQKKKLYAAMGVPEYWVVNTQGNQVFIFYLNDGIYQQQDQSSVLFGLPTALLEATLEQSEKSANGSAALWFAQKIAASQESS